MKRVLTPQACLVLAVLGAVLIVRSIPGPWRTALVAAVWVFGWMVAAVALHASESRPSWDVPPADAGNPTDAAARTAPAAPSNNADRRVLEYGRSPGPEPVAWWVWLGPVSLVCLWARLLEILPIPFHGQRWQRHSMSMLMWAFITVSLPFCGFIVEMIRLGFDGADKRIWNSLPPLAGCTYMLFWLLCAVTFLSLMFAVAELHTW